MGLLVLALLMINLASRLYRWAGPALARDQVLRLLYGLGRLVAALDVQWWCWPSWQ
jgi:hypothetical protein